MRNLLVALNLVFIIFFSESEASGPSNFLVKEKKKYTEEAEGPSTVNMNASPQLPEVPDNNRPLIGKGKRIKVTKFGTLNSPSSHVTASVLEAEEIRRNRFRPANKQPVFPTFQNKQKPTPEKLDDEFKGYLHFLKYYGNNPLNPQYHDGNNGDSGPSSEK